MNTLARLFVTAAVLLLAAAGANAQWQYKTSKDPMSDRQGHAAGVTSKNAYQLAFPYQGGTRGRLWVLEDGSGELLVRFDITRGQLVCEIDGCSLMVRFDDQDQREVRAVRSDDHSSDVLFLEPEDELLEAIKSSKRVRIKATLFQSGSLMFEFVTAGLKWRGAEPAKIPRSPTLKSLVECNRLAEARLGEERKAFMKSCLLGEALEEPAKR